MYHFVLWKWRQDNFLHTYTAEHVRVMRAMLDRHVTLPHRVILVTDDPEDYDGHVYPLWSDLDRLQNISGPHMPSCYRRLKLFDPETQAMLGIEPGHRIVSIDLDAVILKNIDPLLSRGETFVGWGVKGAFQPRAFNGSMFMFTAGEHADVWNDFNAIQSPKVANRAGFMGSDQAWLSYKFARRDDVGRWGQPDVMSYPREVLPMRVLLRNTRIVFFHGKRKPWYEQALRESPWIQRYWRV